MRSEEGGGAVSTTRRMYSDRVTATGSLTVGYVGVSADLISACLTSRDTATSIQWNGCTCRQDFPIRPGYLVSRAGAQVRGDALPVDSRCRIRNDHRLFLVTRVVAYDQLDEPLRVTSPQQLATFQ